MADNDGEANGEHRPDPVEHAAEDHKEEHAATAGAAKPTPKTPAAAAPAAAAAPVGFPSLADTFKLHASKGTEATGAEISKWCKDAGIVGKTCDNGHVDISFTKAKAKGAKNIKFPEMEAFIEELSVKYKTDAKCKSQEEAKTAIIEKLNKTKPKQHGVTKTSKVGGVARMTDTKNYTGSHKERFDDTGKGKGKEGRVDVAANNGYVGAYKEAGTYDKKKAAAAPATTKK